MNYKKFLLPALLLALAAWLDIFPETARAADTIVSGPEETTELWEGKVLTAKFRAGMCISHNGKTRGVLILRHSNGNEDVYHLYGTTKNGEFNLSHSSGHFFSGKFTGQDAIEGKAKLSNGLKLSLHGKRIQNVPLAASDCAPLAQ